MDRRTRVAKALRGENRTLAWHEISALRRRTWLDYADIVLEAADEVPVIEKSNSRLIPDWKWRLTRSWSSWFVAAVTFVGANALNYLDVIASVLAMLPPELRTFIPLPLMILLFGGYALLKMLKQKPAA